MTTTTWDKFLLLLWKNWIIQKRHYCQTLFEILIPVLCCSILLLLRVLVEPKMAKQSIVFRPIPTNRFSNYLGGAKLELAYSPQNPLLDAIVAEAAQFMNTPNKHFTHKGFANARAMESALMIQNTLVGIEFDDSLAFISTELPKELTIALRFPAELRWSHSSVSNWQTMLLMVPFSPRVRNPDENDGGPPSYAAEGFISVQSALSKAIIKQRSSKIDLPPVFVSRIPYPPYYDDPIPQALERMLALIVLLSFFYSCIVMVKHITIEKELQLKEAMKIMGLSGWLHWSAWFVKNILLLIISISLITFLLCVSVNNAAILEYSDWTAVWFFLFIYSTATICFCFMMSVFFSRANMAAGIAGLMWFVVRMPFNMTVSNYDVMSTDSKLGWCLLHNTAMSYGFLETMRMEANQQGLRWSSLFTPATVDDGLSVGLVLVMLLVDALIYLLIALYVEQVMPGAFGVAKPWYFLFKGECWWKQKVIDQPSGRIRRQVSKYFEEEPTSAHAGVEIRNLRKVFSGGRVAVEGLNLKLYEDQITVILGHNGAGKTTTISMLTGMFSPSSGTAYLNGHDIRTDIEGVRQSLGLCPQHNVLFNEMTVAEHLNFFGRLKGIAKKNLRMEIERYLESLDLVVKRNAQSQTLSGGMKRRLAVGIALCGGSKVVLLDEPTSGMDPSARRALWDLLQREKKGRTMLLSTHFMDEADVLGDRIAIMAEGILKTVGSPFFLKKTFGVGYRLICVKGPNCNKDLICNILRRYIPDVRIETDIGSEISFILKEDYIKLYQSMLEELETKMEQCGITSYGISLTTMEEVFLKAGSDTLQDTVNPNGTTIDTVDTLNNIQLLRGKQLMMNQVKAQILKKALSTIRSWVQLVIRNLIPVLFVTFVLARSSAVDKDLPPLTITMASYKQTVTVLEGKSEDPNVKSYQQQFRSIGGSHRLDTITEPMVDYILNRSVESISEVNIRYMVGATFAENYTAWFNNKGYHTAPLALSLLYNAVLSSSCPTCELTVVNKPLPFNISNKFETVNTGMNKGFQLVFNTGFAMAFVAAMYILFYIRERTSRAKLLQYVSGTNILLFWGVAFVWDFAMFIVTSLIYIGTLAAFQEEGWSSFSELGNIFLLLIFFGIAFLPTTYLSSFLFKTPATGFVIVMLLNIASGSIFFVVIVLLKFPGINLQDVASQLEWFFMLFPNFTLTHGLYNINQIVNAKLNCQKLCDLTLGCRIEEMCGRRPDCCIPDLYSFDELGIIRHLLTLTIVGISAFVLILAVECRFVARLMQTFLRPNRQTSASSNTGEDSDVLAEKKRVQMMSMADISNYNLVMKDLTKYYKKFLAVNNLSLAVQRAECFGLVGINGAGKSTTFKMLTGDESFSSGMAWVKGFDALLENLTGRETLKIYALLRGVRKVDISKVSVTLAEDLNFMKHIDKKAKEYSGGNKRKLSTALALMGNPSVIYLDEPTTGMDPGAKRQFWDMICKVRSAGKSIVLTSHSMEECEALCTRLAIMVNGEFKCLGSTQHLKNKFSKGFLLTVKIGKSVDGTLQPQQVEATKSFVMTTFNGAVLKEQYQDSLSFHVPQTDLKWSQMFGLMESQKQRLGIEDYALGQTTLEQVFLFFTKYQKIV
ncbi:phospholipid-transporting ATPase ABCA3-like isoform X2 [Malaya genurostris]|uniref:phospholipid-transporting ATPase ABCA3-like isoform X2 n=1 Tax=Malaya genurostris TaxID=325434 RepID=UPI0026F392E2|nr:phospholipid-transporting ATPase ABCA3-like isoform X2 [Malaya genurostris]